MIRILIIITLLLTTLFSDTINFKQGWNFVGLNNTINLSTDVSFKDSSKVKIIWKYVNDDKVPSQGWHIYTSDATLKQKAEDLGLYYSDTLSYYEGAWIYALKDFSYTVASKNHSFTNSNIPLNGGWNLVSAVDNSNININESIFTDTKATYVYRDGEWYAKFPDGNPSTSTKILTSINSYEAFWIYKDPQSVKLDLISVVKKGTNTATDTLITAQCNTNNGVAIYTGADTNGNGVLDISEYATSPTIVCDGADGVNGTNGTDGLNGTNGADGTDGKDGVNGTDGKDGVNGADGANGTNGATVINPEISFEGARLQGTISTSTGLGRRLYGYLSYPNRSLKLVPKAVSAMSSAKPNFGGKLRLNKYELLSHTFDINVSSDGFYAVDDVPSGGDYSLVYVDSANNLGLKLDDISIKPGETKTVNVGTGKALGSATLKVQALSNNANIAGATVVVSELEKTFTSNSNGDVTITNIPDGTYSLRIDMANYVSKYVKFTVNFGETESLGTLFLNSQKGSLKGRIIIDGIDVPQNVVVYAKSPDGSMFATLTDTNGDYTFNALAVADGYSVITTAHGYANGKIDKLDITNGGTTTASTLTLNKLNSIASGSLRGFARFSDVEDMNHAGIIVSIEGTDQEAITARDGSFVINNIPAGVYNINFTESRYKTITKENLRVVAGATSSLFEVKMIPNIGILTGKVVDDSGIGIGDTSITIVSDLNTYYIPSNSSGDFNISVVAGTYTVSAMKIGYGNNQLSNIVVDYDTTKNINSLELKPNTVIGKINIEGLENNSATIELTNLTVTSDTYSTTSDSAGDFKISPVQGGNYKLVITSSSDDYEITTLTLNKIDKDGYIFATPIKLEKTALAKDYDMLIFDYIKGQNTSQTTIRYNLNLPTTMPNGSSVTWSSTETSFVTNNGLVTLPKSTNSNTLTLSATVGTKPAKDFALTIVKDYQPVFDTNSSTIIVDEDFGYIFKTISASNANGEAITYSLANKVNDTLLTSLEIDANTGELRAVSKANENGTVTFDVVATTNDKSATKSITLNITPVADSVTAKLDSNKTISPNTTINLDTNLSIDIDGDATYSWTLTKPVGSSSSLSSTTVHNPHFTPDKTGTYIATLTMTNGAGSSNDSVSFTVLPTISIADINVTEGNDAVFTVTVSAHDNNVTLNYSTADITAEVFKDYQKTTGTLTFASGELSKTITIPTTADYIPEGTEQFKIVLNNISGAIDSVVEASCTMSYTPMELSYLNGENGFKILNVTESSSNAKTINRVGDFNGDGIDDYAISSTYESGYKGKVYIIFGSTEKVVFGEYDISNADVVITGAAAYDQLGISADGIGDFNGDGIDDIIIGAEGADPSSRSSAGVAYIIYGGLSTNLDLASFAPGTHGVVVYGANASDYLGMSVSKAGDVNGDGFSDAVVGAYGADVAYVIFGGTAVGNSGVVDTASLGAFGIKLSGVSDDRTGYSVDGGEDINGDGYSDILIGAPYNTNRTGNVYIVYGSDSLSNITLSSLGSAGVTISGLSTYDYSGYSVGMLGDINGDGYSDIQFSSYYGDNSYVIFGGDNIFGLTSVSLGDLDGSNGCKIEEPISSTYRSYFAGTGSMDINGDGINDLLYGITKASPNGEESGQGYVIYGDTNICGNGTLTLANLDGSNGFAINGISTKDQTFSTIKHIGDINGDGFDEIGISSYISGKFYVLYGGDHTSSVTHNMIANEILIGTGENETVIASNKVETFNSNGGEDVFIGGPGNDIITIKDLNFKRIDGGNGFDTLIIDVSGKTIDLTTIKPKQLENIEIISFNGSGPNTLILNKEIVLRLSSNHPTTKNFIMLEGGEDDKIQFSDNADWTYTTDDGIALTYIASTFTPTLVTTYTNGDVQIFADSDIAVFPEIIASDTTIVEDAGELKFVIKRSNSIYESTIDYSFTDGTASNNPSDDNNTNYDFYAQAGSLTFYIGELVKSIPIRLIGDDKLEEDKTFTLNLSNVQNATLKSGSESSTITISDNQIGLDYLDGKQGMRIITENYHFGIGKTVSNVGDINGDGYEDMIIGSDSGSQLGSYAYLIYGGSNILDVADLYLTDSTKRVKIRGTGDMAVSGVGDVNGDGYDDLVIGTWNKNDGESYIVFGASDISGGDNEYNLISDSGFVKLSGANNDRAGLSVHTGGDVNGDGYDDILIGAYYNEKLYVVFGKSSWSDFSLSSLDGSDGFVVTGITDSGHNEDRGLSGNGDINGDGYSDIVIGSGDANSMTGATYIIYGSSNLGSGGTFALTSADVAISGVAQSDQAGNATSFGGDINGDGYDDVIIGATGVDGTLNDGAVYVVYGSNSLLDMNLSSLDGGNGFKILGNTEDKLGINVAGGGDINGDGYDDVIIGSEYHLVGGETSMGALYILYGGTVSGSSYNLTNLDTTYGFVIEGYEASTEFGSWMNVTGDFNGDGFSDLLIGAPGTDRVYSNGGEAYVIYGRDFLGKQDYYGTNGADDFNMPYNEEKTAYGLQGNDDIWFYNGPDVVFGGQGDDRIGGYGFSNDASIGKMNAGRGFDELYFGYGTTSMDFRDFMNNRLKGFEKLELTKATDSGVTNTNYSITMSKIDILRILDTNQHTFYIRGDSNDSVTITDGTWTSLGDTGDGYNTWSLNNSPIKLKIDNDINITMP